MRSFWPDYSDRVVEGFVVVVIDPFFSVLGVFEKVIVCVFNIVGTVIFVVLGWPFALFSWLRE